MADTDKQPVDSEMRAGVAAADSGPVLEWTVHPVKRQPLVSAAVTLFVVLVAVFVYSWMQSHWFTILALVIMLGSLAKFYFPTQYKLTDRAVTVKSTTQTLVKEWKLYRNCYPDKKGILLSPFVTPSRLENFRGLYLMFEGNAEQVTSFVRERIARSHENAATTEAKSSSEGSDR
ncbi:MAG: hypothetical protein AB1772_13140 [Candidatus Zixiibacteriota bacterium]